MVSQLLNDTSTATGATASTVQYLPSSRNVTIPVDLGCHTIGRHSATLSTIDHSELGRVHILSHADLFQHPVEGHPFIFSPTLAQPLTIGKFPHDPAMRLDTASAIDETGTPATIWDYEAYYADAVELLEQRDRLLFFTEIVSPPPSPSEIDLTNEDECERWRLPLALARRRGNGDGQHLRPTIEYTNEELDIRDTDNQPVFPTDGKVDSSLYFAGLIIEGGGKAKYEEDGKVLTKSIPCTTRYIFTESPNVDLRTHHVPAFAMTSSTSGTTKIPSEVTSADEEYNDLESRWKAAFDGYASWSAEHHQQLSAKREIERWVDQVATDSFVENNSTPVGASDEGVDNITGGNDWGTILSDYSSALSSRLKGVLKAVSKTRLLIGCSYFKIP